MRRTPAPAAATHRISLHLPAEPRSVSLAENAARGLLAHRSSRVVEARLVATTVELSDAGLARARRRDRLWVHYDVADGEITVTVELRRPGRWQARTPFRASLAVESTGASASG
ncbi:MAG: hypothetical protein OXG52_12445 [bacterium]|nr:hypothetical protein [bacterium]